MRDFVDLRGASGNVYRFRLWDINQAHLPIAGNYALVRSGPGGLDVLQIGTTEDLSKIRDKLALSPAELNDVGVYTRLNVPRPIRVGENEDLVANYSPPLNEEGRLADQPGPRRTP